MMGDHGTEFLSFSLEVFAAGTRNKELVTCHDLAFPARLKAKR